MMKKMMLYILFGLMTIFISCTHDLGNKITEETQKIINTCDGLMDYKIVAIPDNIAIVTIGNDTLAVTDMDMTIKVPKNTKVLTKSTIEEIKLEYVNEKDDPEQYNALKHKTYSAYWQAVMFEDSKNADYDFNDLVIHVRNKVEYTYNNKKDGFQTVDIQPIALGSTKTIGLGCILSDGSEYIISDDVRQDLFDGVKGFINTYNMTDPIMYHFKNTEINKYPIAYKADQSYWVAWFIVCDGRRYYAVSGDYKYASYNEVLTTDLLPYGLVVGDKNGTFDYPEEKINIAVAYPEFMLWVKGEKSKIGEPIKEYIYKYCYSNTINGKYKIWDYNF